MKKIMFLLLAIAMVSLTSCFETAGNQEASEVEVVEDTIQVVEVDSTEVDTTSWFELNENDSLQ